VQQRLAAARLENPITATGNYSYQSTKMYGRNFLLVGDAYAFIDPVFSSGVHLALQGAFRGAETIDRILADPRAAGTELEKYRREIEGGLRTFSWFIYRITTPAVRELFMYPRNILGVKEGVLSLLAGDLFRETPLKFRLLVFRVIYYLTTLLMPKASLAAHRRRRKNLAV
jgi:flavin-dependent dehydrogenase